MSNRLLSISVLTAALFGVATLALGCGMHDGDGGDTQMRQGREEMSAGLQQVRDAVASWKTAPEPSAITDMRHGMGVMRAGHADMRGAMMDGHCQHESMDQMMVDMGQALTSMEEACDMMEDKSLTNDGDAARLMADQANRIEQDLGATQSCAEHCAGGSMM